VVRSRQLLLALIRKQLKLLAFPKLLKQFFPQALDPASMLLQKRN
jgi:hypothetical protein